MAQTYSETHLALKDPTDPNWALAYARFLLRDKPNEAGVFPADSLDNAEIDVMLEATTVVDTYPATSVTYYRPHEAAALILDSNPEFLMTYAESNTSGKYRDVASIVRGVKAAGAWIDDKIRSLTNGRVGGTSLEVRL